MKSNHARVRSLKVRNFKGIGELDLPLNESLTLLVGVNGVGKTAAIEALLGAVAKAWSWLGQIEPEEQIRRSGSLVRSGAPEGRITLELGFGNEVVRTCDVSVLARGLEVVLPPHELPDRRSNADAPLPLIVHYDQNRIGGLGFSGHRSHSEFNGEGAPDTIPVALSDFETWYCRKEGEEVREALHRGDPCYKDPELRVVGEVLTTITGGLVEFRSRTPEGKADLALFLKKGNGFDIPFDALSGGEKAYFLLAIDLAQQLLLEFPGRPIAEAPGLVCIDEIELHLHPAWQRQILMRLMELFPCCQFVVSTHSPQVIGSVSARHVRLLESNGNGHIEVTSPIASKGRDSNHVLEGILNTPKQDSVIDGLFAKFDRLVDAGEYAEANDILDELEKLMEGNSPQVGVRRAKCRRLQKASE